MGFGLREVLVIGVAGFTSACGQITDVSPSPTRPVSPATRPVITATVSSRVIPDFTPVPSATDTPLSHPETVVAVGKDQTQQSNSRPDGKSSVEPVKPTEKLVSPEYDWVLGSSSAKIIKNEVLDSSEKCRGIFSDTAGCSADGFNGEKISDLVKRVDAGLKPDTGPDKVTDIVVILGRVNDLASDGEHPFNPDKEKVTIQLTGNPAEDKKDSIVGRAVNLTDKLLAKFKNARITFVLATPTRVTDQAMTDRQRIFNTEYRQIYRNNPRVFAFDARDIISKYGDKAFRDNIHFFKEVYIEILKAAKSAANDYFSRSNLKPDDKQSGGEEILPRHQVVWVGKPPRSYRAKAIAEYKFNPHQPRSII